MDSGATISVTDSIILNNTAATTTTSNKMFSRVGDSGSFTLNYNWWGHNSTNKGSLTPVIPAKPTGSTLNIWRYLSANTNVTSYDVLLVNETVLMNFDLNHYTGSSSGTRAVDFPTISLNLTGVIVVCEFIFIN